LGVYPAPVINPIITYSETIFSDFPEIVSLPTITGLNTKIVASAIIVQDEYASFLDRDDTNFHHSEEFKSIKFKENR